MSSRDYYDPQFGVIRFLRGASIAGISEFSGHTTAMGLCVIFPRERRAGFVHGARSSSADPMHSVLGDGGRCSEPKVLIPVCRA